MKEKKLKANLAASYESYMRGIKHKCKVGSVVEYNSKKYLVAITTQLNVYLISRYCSVMRLNWKEWKNGVTLMNEHPFWSKRISSKIEKISLMIVNSVLKRKEAEKYPVIIIRKPAKKHKGIIRR